MNTPLSWIKAYVPELDVTAQEYTDAMTPVSYTHLYYAKNMGLPIDKLICASNENKVLFDFFNTGVYDRNREFILTSSPSMDILISSNLERLVYKIAGESAEKNQNMMKALASDGKYEITGDMKEKLKDFYRCV